MDSSRTPEEFDLLGLNDSHEEALQSHHFDQNASAQQELRSTNSQMTSDELNALLLMITQMVSEKEATLPESRRYLNKLRDTVAQLEQHNTPTQARESLQQKLQQAHDLVTALEDRLASEYSSGIPLEIRQEVRGSLHPQLLSLHIRLADTCNQLVARITNDSSFAFSRLHLYKHRPVSSIPLPRALHPGEMAELTMPMPYDDLHHYGYCQYFVVFASVRVSPAVDIGECEITQLSETKLAITNRMTQAFSACLFEEEDRAVLRRTQLSLTSLERKIVDIEPLGRVREVSLKTQTGRISNKIVF